VLELGSLGSVRGALSNGRPYREPRSRAVVGGRYDEGLRRAGSALIRLAWGRTGVGA
jgi:hypothetical protein